MTPPIKLISTDFDGTLYADFDDPPIPRGLASLLGELKSQGAKWVINTGRDMSSLMEALGRASLDVTPDFLVLVEREIHSQQGAQYVQLEEWNAQCTRAHEETFARVHEDLPRITAWINERFEARIYEDDYSPFCLIAGTNDEADVIHKYLDNYCRSVPQLTVVRNDVYARFSHVAFNKGTALAEVTRQLELAPSEVFAVGDHWNDLPMLSREYAQWLAAPGNAVEEVKAAVRRQGGYVSKLANGNGVEEALKYYLNGGGRPAGSM